MPTSFATLEQKNGVLEFTKLEYHKKWYFPNYFRNSALLLNISKIDANGPFSPLNAREHKVTFVREQKVTFVFIYLLLYSFNIWHLLLMIFLFFIYFFIIKLKHQLIFGVSSKKKMVFGVDGDQALNLLFDIKIFYQ